MADKPEAIGTASDFNNMLNQYKPRKKKTKYEASFSPWTQMNKIKQGIK